MHPTTPGRRHIRYRHAGEEKSFTPASPRAMLLDHIRHDLGLTGTKEGCNEGDCGACTVVLKRWRDGREVSEPVNACIVLAGQIDGAELVTVEDLSAGGALHPVQAAMIEHHGSQCGFCTPGIVMSLYALHENRAGPVGRAEVLEALQGNLCRCTGYRPIVAAALAACGGPVIADDDPTFPFGAARTPMADDEGGPADLFIGDDATFFAAPSSEASLAALLLAHPDALIVAGATDVGLWITKRLDDPKKIVWLGRVESLRRIRHEPDRIVIGAGVAHAEALPALDAIDPDLGLVMRRFGSAQVRASGTVGGNIANGSPIGDLAPCLIALDATLTLRRGDAERTIPLEDFFVAYGRQDRAASEFVSAIGVPRLSPAQHLRVFKLSKRFEEDITSALLAIRVTLDGRRIAEARIACGGMAGTPKRAPQTESALAGVSLDQPESWSAAMLAFAADFQPLDDMRASARYRMEGVRALLRRALVEIAGGGPETRLVPRGWPHAMARAAE